MPDLTRCVREGGKVYCWDSEKKMVVEIVEVAELRVIPVAIKDCPESVLTSMLSAAMDENRKE
jgi:hypothetical protein